MRLSIYPEVKPLPSKSEKAKESKFASNPYLPEIAEVSTDEELLTLVTSFAYSPAIFKGSRSKENFVSTDFLVLDVDDGLRIEDAEKRILESGYACLCVATASHTEEQHRYRLLFPLSRTITKMADFEASILDLMEAFPESDPACKDASRFFFSGTTVEGFWIDGELLEPLTAPEPIKSSYDSLDRTSSIPVDATLEQLVIETYGELRSHIPEAVAFFMREAPTGLPGIWNSSLNKAVYILGLQNIEEEVVEDLIAHLAPYSLDKSDLNTIKRSWRDGQRDRVED